MPTPRKAEGASEVCCDCGLPAEDHFQWWKAKQVAVPLDKYLKKQKRRKRK